MFILLMLFSTTIDYICGLFISESIGEWGKPIKLLNKNSTRTKVQYRALLISIISNLSLLAFFKYFNFGIESYNGLMTGLGFDNYQYDSFFRVILPLGISFYTFQSMSYTIDIYRGNAKAIRNFIDFTCFVSMFPQLVAGPIIRFQEIANQLETRTHTIQKFTRGIAFFSLGLAKKILLANPCGKIADSCFNAVEVGFIDSWYGAIAYAFQIYFDFSGYTDMAIGIGLMLGFVFSKNFDSPYSSRSITDFWRKWHISLSTWLRDYLYIPLGGNKKGKHRTYINLMIVMLLGGLWHGASWNFVIWGIIHGVFLSIERMVGKESLYKKLPKNASILVTFIIVVFAWVFFRSDTLSSAINYLSSMLGFNTNVITDNVIDILIWNPYYLLCFIISAIVVWFFPQTWDFTKKITIPKAVYILTLFTVSVITLLTQSFNPFIYFIF
ncbi:MBOAT family O-acyltransferase [Tenacibaculum todarodis]|nr:MBOAT family O-acyltransferase [Tenacibaculum todarodis]